jgi:hypothetical protein
MTSIPYLPSSQANSGYQQSATQPHHALAPRSQSMVVLGTQSVLMIGQATSGQSGLCQHFAEVCKSTYQWMPVSETDMQRLGALNVPSQVVLIGTPSGVSPFTGNVPEQKYVSKPSQHFLNSIEILQTHIGLNAVPPSQHRYPSRA